MIAGTFASGVQVGKWSWWYDDGRLYKSGVFDELGRDQGTWRFFHADGTLWREGAYADGAPVGVWREWHDNGQLASEGELVPEPAPEEDRFTLDDDGVKSSVRAGTWREWWPNGRLRAEGEWQDGFPVEPHRWWHEDGTPSERRIGG